MSNIKGKEQLHTAEQLSLVDYIYHILWRKSPFFGHMTNILLPDTVVFKYEQAIAWYFIHDGQMKCKNKSNLTIDKINEKFLKRVPSCGVVATFFRKLDGENSQKFTMQHLDVESFSKCPCSKNIEECFTNLFIEELFNNKRAIPNGILQRFVQPKGNKNFAITARWSGVTCFFEKTESKTNINNTRLDIYNRIPTVDGNSLNTTRRSLRGKVLPSLLDKICYNIVQHVKNASRGNVIIKRLVCHFKVDHKDRIYFLFCSGIRFNHSTPSMNNGGAHNPPSILKNAPLKKPPTLEKQIKLLTILDPVIVPPLNRVDHFSLVQQTAGSLHKDCKCLSCDSHSCATKMYQISISSIVLSFDRGRLIKTNNELVSLGQKNISKFLQNPEEILLIEKEENQEKKSTLGRVEEDNRGGRPEANQGFKVFKKIESIIPPILKKVFPEMEYEAYQKLKKSKTLLKQSIPVCEECYLFHMRLNEFSGTETADRLLQIMGQQDYFGTGRLRPEALRLRLQDTQMKLENQKREKVMRGGYFDEADYQFQEQQGRDQDQGQDGDTNSMVQVGQRGQKGGRKGKQRGKKVADLEAMKLYELDITLDQSLISSFGDDQSSESSSLSKIPAQKVKISEPKNEEISLLKKVQNSHKLPSTGGPTPNEISQFQSTTTQEPFSGRQPPIISGKRLLPKLDPKIQTAGNFRTFADKRKQTFGNDSNKRHSSIRSTSQMRFYSKTKKIGKKPKQLQKLAFCKSSSHSSFRLKKIAKPSNKYDKQSQQIRNKGKIKNQKKAKANQFFDTLFDMYKEKQQVIN